MALTYRSTTPETITIVEQESDGRSRVAVATKNLNATKHWDLVVQNPSGETWPGSFTGDKAEVPLALAQMLARTENQFKSDRARGDRPAQPTYDHNRRVVESASPITRIPGRG
jgi:hypothetical protein